MQASTENGTQRSKVHAGSIGTAHQESRRLCARLDELYLCGYI